MKLKSFILFICFISGKYSLAQSSFTFCGNTIDAGTKQHFKIPVVDDEHKTFIPITVFCGVEKGPVLGITAGVHGYEYPPIIAAQRLITSVNPKTLKGVLILVQIANIESFKSRSPYVNPLDDKNLNRSFPGDVKGSITEKIADFITNNIIDKSDFFLDMHAGDAPEDLMPYSAYYSNSSKQNASQQGKEMAKSLLFNHIVVFSTDGKDYIKEDKPSLYCSAEAFKRGIPSADIECGGLGKSEKEAVLKIETGVLNMLKHLGMTTTSNEAKTNNSYKFIKDRE